MKHTKIFRILGIAVILSLLMIAIPAAPALAVKDIDLDPDSGDIDDTITISGSGFSQSIGATIYYVDIYFAADDAGTTDDIGSDINTYERLKQGVEV